MSNLYESWYLQIPAPQPPPPKAFEDIEDKEEDKQTRVIEVQV